MTYNVTVWRNSILVDPGVTHSITLHSSMNCNGTGHPWVTEDEEIVANSLPTSHTFCRLLIIFANSLKPDRARHNVGPDLNPNCLALWWYSWNSFWKKLIFKKSADGRQKKIRKNFPTCKELKRMVWIFEKRWICHQIHSMTEYWTRKQLKISMQEVAFTLHQYQ